MNARRSKVFLNGRTKGLCALTREQHEELKRLRREENLSIVKLAAMFDISVPTAYKWLELPLGYKAAYGRKRKTPAMTVEGADTTCSDNPEHAQLDDSSTSGDSAQQGAKTFSKES